MERTIEWLRSRPYFHQQITSVRRQNGSDGQFKLVDIDSRLNRVLTEAGIERTYQHQADALESVRAGRNVVVATPTASGKSLVYTIASFEAALTTGRCSLYIAPQVALINDQTETLKDFARSLEFGTPVTVGQYTGQLSKTEKKRVRDQRPTILLTTPDMVHYGILPHAHRLWDWFFDRLEYVVLDEIHEYRGVFGTHVSQVLRRLARVADRFNSDPSYLCFSATVGNPREHAKMLTNAPSESFEVIAEDTSESGPTQWVFWNPPTYTHKSGETRRRSNHVESKNLFVDLVSRGFQTVVFTRSRQAAERYATESAEALSERGESSLASAVTAYQAALKTEVRNDIEEGLHSGELRGVWSTNALELGVDIGGLDVIILDGYPGTRLSAFQQAGRAGRGDDSSLVVLVGSENQLDQYFIEHPSEFFEGELENAVVNPANEEILPEHIKCAARENWLNPTDDEYFGSKFPGLVTDLENAGMLERRSTSQGIRWTYAGEGSPQHEMSLRSIGDREIQLIASESGTTIGSLPFADALRDVHPGAIYHHQGQSYEVTDLDLSRDLAELSPVSVDYYTQVLHEKEIEVNRELESKSLEAREDALIQYANITMHKQITGYERRDQHSGERYGISELTLPEITLNTKALYFTVPGDVEIEMRSRQGDFNGGIHAAEHGLIAMFPLELLCDRRDIGGLSTPFHPHTEQSTIFIYDGYPGGVGLTRRGYENIDHLIPVTRDMINSCECSQGCPSCVQSPHCGNANEPLDKSLASYLLSKLSAPVQSNS